MDKRLHRFLKYIAIVLTLAWVGWTLYDTFFFNTRPGDYAYHAGSNYFADGHYENALAEYEKALVEDAGHTPALRGMAETLIMLKREQEAVAIYHRLIALEPNKAGHYANLGIAYDRLGKHKIALANYEKALNLDPEVGEGPGWLTRFLRNQPNKPPGIADRAHYIREQLALAPDERLLHAPEIDAAQRPYKQ
jgi:tetratricopeptide (TPR) repeat protein